MELRQIFTGKTDFMDLLLLGDEQEDMVMKYLERGEMAVLFDGEDTIAVSVVTKEEEGLWELKNIAVLPSFQGKGYGTEALSSAIRLLANENLFSTIQINYVKGNFPAKHLYEKFGFEMIGVRRNFYEKPVEDAIVMRLQKNESIDCQ